MIHRFPILAERLATFWALVLKEVQGLELVSREVAERVFFQRLAFPPPSMRISARPRKGSVSSSSASEGGAVALEESLAAA